MKKAIDIAGRVALGAIGITTMLGVALAVYLFAPPCEADKSRHWE